jgi:hypothetical protein
VYVVCGRIISLTNLFRGFNGFACFQPLLLWHIDPLQSNDRETRQRPLLDNGSKITGMAFSARSEKQKFFLIPFYLQAVHVHLVNGIKLIKA